MKQDKDWYWKSDEEVGLTRSRERFRVGMLIFIMTVTAAILGGWLLIQGVKLIIVKIIWPLLYHFLDYISDHLV
ncbi:hypothetical protein [Paenibacillus rhizophilus]|uniref:Uncharacterized protein n=1 Tax=Paenibacillus rhizophilus TaxID=1850366 RepID=A0A3N9PWE0_9BACL|nr:hypothetical protein [Paenibacillus rhizophilus]RQW09566.1 hypothetical protein EH198_19015 [Paenibacillus rhizophilus]